MTYYRSQLIPFDPRTVVYWSVDVQGETRDLRADDIPEGSTVVDVTTLYHTTDLVKIEGQLVKRISQKRI